MPFAWLLVFPGNDYVNNLTSSISTINYFTTTKIARWEWTRIDVVTHKSHYCDLMSQNCHPRHQAYYSCSRQKLGTCFHYDFLSKVGAFYVYKYWSYTWGTIPQNCFCQCSAMSEDIFYNKFLSRSLLFVNLVCISVYL